MKNADWSKVLRDGIHGHYRQLSLSQSKQSKPMKNGDRYSSCSALRTTRRLVETSRVLQSLHEWSSALIVNLITSQIIAHESEPVKIKIALLIWALNHITQRCLTCSKSHSLVPRPPTSRPPKESSKLAIPWSHSRKTTKSRKTSRSSSVVTLCKTWALKASNTFTRGFKAEKQSAKSLNKTRKIKSQRDSLPRVKSRSNRRC